MKRYLRTFAACVIACATGCASYTRSKIDLTDQARRGIALVRDATASRQASLDAIANERRKQLDAAFDADVAAHAASMTGEWVTAHRKAYAIGIDAIAGQQHIAEAVQATTLSNLDAVDAALVQLQQMHATELQFTLPEVKR